MAALKTKPTDASVEDFIEQIENKQRKADCLELLNMCAEVTEELPKMWGESMIGFGKYHYRYKSGHNGDWFLTGFSPRKQNLTVYIMAGFRNYGDLLKRLGKYKTSLSCLYLRRLDDVDKDVLKELISKSVEDMKQSYG